MTRTTPDTAEPPAPSTGFGRLGAWCYDHRRRVLLAWIALVIAIVAVSTAAGSHYENNFGGGGQSQQAQNLLHERFPAHAGDSAQVVFHTTGPLNSPANAQRIAAVNAAVRPLAHVTAVTSPFAPGTHAVSADGRTGFSTIQFDKVSNNLPKADVKHVVSVARSFARPGFEVALGGNPISNVVTASPGSSEGIGITAAIIIMLIAFGSVVAMGLPILTALVGVGTGFGIIALLSFLITVPSFGPEMMAMIGLGVGIDYALFIVTRYRQGLSEGRTPRQAVVVAHMTAGRSVLFAGGTVIISLLGLLLVGQAFMTGLALGAIAAVCLVLAAALTLLPAMLGFSGRAIDRLHVPGLLHSANPMAARGFWWRWSRTVQRRPAVCGLVAIGLLILLALPMFSLRQAFSDASNDPTKLTTRQAYDLLASGFGPGYNGPLVLAADVPAGGGRAAVDTLDRQLQTTAGVAATSPAIFNASGNAAVITLYPTTGPQAAQTATLVHQLRDHVVPNAVGGSDVRVYVGGETAAGVDASSYLSGRLPWVIGGVIVLAFLLLMLLFRSIAIPLKAALMNLLSIGAAYGVIVAVFQWGWGVSLLGLTKGPIDPWIPMMMFTITFGLSMDYEVFLLSRMREEWRRTGVSTTAIADGLASTARVITAAAAIMVCVFGSFVIGDPLRVLDVFGLGLAAAILVDATLVRMVLVPSIMELLGNANWWMPSWLDRRLPRLGAEATVAPAPVNADLAQV